MQDKLTWICSILAIIISGMAITLTVITNKREKEMQRNREMMELNQRFYSIMQQRQQIGYESKNKTTGSHNTYISRPAARTRSAIGVAPLKSMPPQNTFEGAIIGHGEPPKRPYRRGSGPPPNVHEPVLTNEELTRKIESLERRLNKLEREKKDAK